MTDEWDDESALHVQGDFLTVIRKDGRMWVGRTTGTHMPDDGTLARSETLQGLKDEADRQAEDAYRQATGGFLSFTGWSYEYEFGQDTDGKGDDFGQARIAQAEADRQWWDRGHEIAADLAAVHGATPAEIADILNLCCAAEAAMLIDYSGPGLIGHHSCPHDETH